MAWALQDAKARFSEVVKRAQSEGPQHITVRGAPTVVVISEAELAGLREKAGIEPTLSFEEFLMSGPSWPDDFVDEIIARPQDFGRDIDL